MKKISIIAVAFTTVLVTSCGLFQKVEHYGSRTQDVYNRTIFTQPMVAEIDVNINKKIEGYAEDKSLNIAKEKAMQDALTKSGADVLVDPVFTWSQKAFKKAKVTVQGYYGKYKAVRPMDIPDSLLYRMAGSGTNLEIKGGKSPIMKFSR